MYPTLYTRRMILRGFTLEDAPVVQKLAGDINVAKTTSNIPHPYEDGMAEAWIRTHLKEYMQGMGVNFAIEKQKERELIGAVGLHIQADHDTAMLGYWIGTDYWGNGYCTEAAREVVRYGFTTLKLNRIHSNHFGSNPASGRVMKKCGMTKEGVLRQHIKKWGRYDDLVLYGILRSEYMLQ
jgi:RimJ/RimL family protein N-acetyltransferase